MRALRVCVCYVSMTDLRCAANADPLGKGCKAMGCIVGSHWGRLSPSVGNAIVSWKGKRGSEGGHVCRPCQHSRQLSRQQSGLYLLQPSARLLHRALLRAPHMAALQMGTNDSGSAKSQKSLLVGCAFLSDSLQLIKRLYANR